MLSALILKVLTLQVPRASSGRLENVNWILGVASLLNEQVEWIG